MKLAGRLEEGEALDVADGAADLGEGDVDVGPSMLRTASLISFVMWGMTWTVWPRYSPPPLLGDDGAVDLGRWCSCCGRSRRRG